LAATGRENHASFWRKVVARGADQIIVTFGSAATTASLAPHQAEEGAEDDQAEDEPSARQKRTRRDDGVALDTATATGGIACAGPVKGNVEVTRVGAQGGPPGG